MSPYRTPARCTHRYHLDWLGPIGSWGPMWHCMHCKQPAGILRSFWLDLTADHQEPELESTRTISRSLVGPRRRKP